MIPAGRIWATRIAVFLLTLSAQATFAAQESAGFALDSVVFGASGEELRKAFGEPQSGERAGSGVLRREDFALIPAGYAQVNVWYDAEETLHHARVIPARSLKLAAAVLLFDLRSGAVRTEGHCFVGAEVGHFLHYSAEGVHFFVDQDRVVEIWRTAANIAPTQLPQTLGVTYPAQQITSAAAAVTSNEVEPAPVRSLMMTAPTISIVLDDQYRPQFAITAVVFANGLRDQEIHFEGILKRYPATGEDARPLAVQPTAPATLRDASGNLRPSFSETVLFDTSRFGTPTLLFPLHLLQDYDSNFSGHFQVSFEVRCGEFACYSTVVASLPGPSLQDIGAIPSVTAGPIAVEPGEVEGLGVGLWIYREVTVKGARGRSLDTYLVVRHADGRPVLAAPGWDAWRLQDGRFFSKAQDEVLHDESSWNPFRTFLPFSGLALEPGEYELILRTQTSVETLGGAVERLIQFTMPSAAEVKVQHQGGRQ